MTYYRFRKRRLLKLMRTHSSKDIANWFQCSQAFVSLMLSGKTVGPNSRRKIMDSLNKRFINGASFNSIFESVGKRAKYPAKK